MTMMKVVAFAAGLAVLGAAGAAAAGIDEIDPAVAARLYNKDMLDPAQPVGPSAWRDFVAKNPPPWKIGYASSYAGNTWRAGAMIAALMIGVTLFTTVRARGESILKSWSFPAKFPDLVLFSPTSVSAKRIDLIRKDHPEAAEISGLAAFPVKMPNSAFRVGEVLANGSTNFVAVDPQSFPTMVEMDFIQGDRQSALRKLAEGGHILISKEFYNARGLGVGDKLTFLDHEGKTVDFTIAGVVTSNGMDMAKNYFDLRSTFQEAAISSVLGTLDDARKHFQLNGVNLMLLNLNPQAANAAASNKLREDLQQEGFQSASSVEMKTGIRDLIQHVVDILSIISVGGLCVASLGVANMVIASVHARRFEFGVLRAIGAGRWQLIRLVLAEVTLIGLVAGILGALAGLHFTFMGTLVDRTMVGFPTKFLSPTWPGRLVAIRDSLFVAAAITILLAWLASLLPAIKGAYAAQRTLLAGGRA